MVTRRHVLYKKKRGSDDKKEVVPCFRWDGDESRRNGGRGGETQQGGEKIRNGGSKGL